MGEVITRLLTDFFRQLIFLMCLPDLNNDTIFFAVNLILLETGTSPLQIWRLCQILSNKNDCNRMRIRSKEANLNA